MGAILDGMDNSVSEPELVTCSGVVLVLMLVVLEMLLLLEIIIGAYWKRVIRSCGFRIRIAK